MPTVVYTADQNIQLSGISDAGGTFSWTGASVNGFGGDVTDQNDDGDLDTAVDTFLGATTYTGYTVNVGGNEYAIFSDGVNGFIPYDSAVQDVGAVFGAGAGSTTTTNENGVAENFCFMDGTLIATPDGETAVEDLQIGDLITTAEGTAVPVKWVGKQSVRTPANLVHDEYRAPVRIAAGTLDNHSDLYVSADHGMIVDGLVINASALVNHTTVRFVRASEMRDDFTYYHIETEKHDVVIANGAKSETFIDSAGRAAFDNHQEYLDLYGVERIIPEMDNPRINSSRLVPQAIKDRIAPEDTGGQLRKTARKIAGLLPSAFGWFAKPESEDQAAKKRA